MPWLSTLRCLSLWRGRRVRRGPACLLAGLGLAFPVIGLAAFPVPVPVPASGPGFSVAGQAAGTAETGAGGRFLQQVLKTSPTHEESLRALLHGARGLPSWVRNMLSNPRYVSGASQAVTVDGQAMELFSACLAGQCAASQLRLLFLSDGKALALRVADHSLGEVVLGQPSSAALAQLRRAGL
ncbi:Ivy family c-type lysozyme inhibitor [Rhizobium sp. SSA_523]|uniref:Ivy family c-type lysozyme inhibitor n=1 Tax=Rhizobium sp. SSA_523 TaxID=2952477 RepID=UPI002091C3BA|nr:Ivy family c-type lysozyme inhibitor [Rhizobium sp. SSA_523]MCO5731012.1 inhibitor of vertebrate lysozyme family protein [Rhizobium sp. SSA_523]WKC24184.1 Ivy family c-type lysozyme inhibitor [Rhizobium sp. SSA_523]